MTAKRTRKLFRKRMWCVVGGSHDWLVFYTYQRAHECAFDNGGTLIRVAVSEIPKPSPRKKVRRGK